MTFVRRGKKTPLHCAVMGGSLTLVELLLRKGADPVAKDDLGKTPLTYAENFDEDTKVDDETFVKTNKSIIKVLQRYKKLNDAKAKFASKKPTQKKPPHLLPSLEREQRVVFETKVRQVKWQTSIENSV